MDQWTFAKTKDPFDCGFAHWDGPHGYRVYQSDSVNFSTSQNHVWMDGIYDTLDEAIAACKADYLRGAP